MKRIGTRRKKANTLRLWFSGVVEGLIAPSQIAPHLENSVAPHAGPNNYFM